MNKKPDLLKIIINVTALSLILMALLQTLAQYLPDPKVDAFTAKIVTLPAAKIPPLLGRGKPVMLVVYASWCPYCRKMMPDLLSLIEEHKLDKVTPIFISIDKDPRSLSKYVVHKDYQTLFTPYLVPQGANLPAALEPTGSGYSGIIPYIGFFDASGSLTHELQGQAGREDLLKAADELK